MREPRGDPDLAGESFGAEQRAELGAEDLDGHLAVVLQVVGQVDGGHTATAELVLDGVAAGEAGSQPIQLSGCHPGRGGDRGGCIDLYCAPVPFGGQPSVIYGDEPPLSN